ncbi:MAG: type II secretion system F family protein [Thiohalomonadaceae bacterium]
MTALLYALGAASFLLSLGLLALAVQSDRRRHAMRRRLRAALGIGGDQRREEMHGLSGQLARLGSLWLSSHEEDPELVKLLARAGWRRQQDQALLAGLQLVLPLATTLVTALAWFGTGGGFSLRAVSYLFAAFALGYLAPKYLLRYLGKRRQRLINEEVPLLAQVLKVLFDAGLGLDQALLTVSTEHADMVPVLASELRPVMRQVSRGADRSEALVQMARTQEVQDLTDLVTLLRQIDRYGGGIQQPLKNFVDLIDERRRTELHERVGKLSGSMTIVMVLFLFPALLVFLAGPGFLAIVRMLTGFGG